MTALVAGRPRDCVRAGLSRTTETLRGADVVASSVGLHRSRRVGTTVYVDTCIGSTGTTWAAVSLPDAAATDAIPTLGVDGQDDLWCCYHDAAGLRIYRSRDWGRTWALWREVAGGRWGRMLFVEATPQVPAARQYLAVYLGSGVTLYESSDWLQTLGSGVLAFSADPQLVDLGLDRRGWVHVTYEASGNAYQRLSPDARDWTRPADLLATGRTRPSLAAAMPRGILLLWNADALSADQLAGDYVSAAGAPESITTTLTRQYLGLAFDRSEDAWLFGLEDDDSATIMVNRAYGRGDWQSLP